jgi:hypothetical protein
LLSALRSSSLLPDPLASASEKQKCIN